MTYSVDQNKQVTAELDLKLDPSIARQFGKSAQQSVEGNDGKLVRLEIGSSDEGQVIEQASKQKNDRSAQIAQLQQELAKTKPGTPARANLMSQIQALQQQASEQSRVIESSQAALATTPMAFHYYGRGGVPGFRGNPVREAWHTFVTTVVWLVGMLLQALAVLIPVGLLIAALVALWRTRPMRALRRWIKGPQELDG
jgi:Flp pilus assembly protein TadB